MKLLNNVTVKLIKFYQVAISPYIIPSCKFKPTCSEYSRQAFEKYNFIKALYLTIYRILRCNPFSKGGDDPLK